MSRYRSEFSRRLSRRAYQWNRLSSPPWLHRALRKKGRGFIGLVHRFQKRLLPKPMYPIEVLFSIAEFYGLLKLIMMYCWCTTQSLSLSPRVSSIRTTVIFARVAESWLSKDLSFRIQQLSALFQQLLLLYISLSSLALRALHHAFNIIVHSFRRMHEFQQ